MYGVVHATRHRAPRCAIPELARLTGLPFDDSDDVIRAAIDQASVPALLMSMVHMTGDLGVLDELPRPFMLIAMDLQGGMSEPDKQAGARTGFRGRPRLSRPRVPAAVRPRRAPAAGDADVMSAGQVTEEFVDYIAADLRITDDRPERAGRCLRPPEQRAGFPVVVIGCGESGLLAGIKLKAAGIPFTIIDRQSGVGGTWLANRYPGCRVDIASQYYTYSFEPTDHWEHHYADAAGDPAVPQRRDGALRDRRTRPVRHRGRPARSGTRRRRPGGCGSARRTELLSDTLTARGLICAVGQFSNPVIPDIKGAK